MARKVKDKELDSREARGKLKPRGKPYWRAIERGLHLGYRRLKGKAGTWWARHYAGEQRYEVESIGIADDLSNADGVAVLDYWQAQTAARERMVNRAHAAAGVSGPLTVKDAVEQYLEWLEGNRKSIYDARRRAEAFITPRLGDIECSALTAEMVRAWHSGLVKERARVRTAPGEQQRYRVRDAGDSEVNRQRRVSANRVFAILKAALNRAWREAKITSDAQWRRVEPFQNVSAARTRYLSVAEAKRLINASGDEFRPLVQAALMTGARYGELCRLEVADFNPDAGTIAIRQSKSGKARHVVLTQEGAVFFRQLTTGRGGHEILLPRADGAAFGRSHQIYRMAAVCTRAKITPPIGFHQLRHTWASLSVMNGVPLMIVAKNLGHSDTRMVEKHYGHLAPSYVTDAIRKGAPQFGFKPDPKMRSFEKSGAQKVI
jgi:integrase